MIIFRKINTLPELVKTLDIVLSYVSRKIVPETKDAVWVVYQRQWSQEQGLMHVRASMLSNWPLLWKQNVILLGAIWETSWSLTGPKKKKMYLFISSLSPCSKIVPRDINFFVEEETQEQRSPGAQTSLEWPDIHFHYRKCFTPQKIRPSFYRLFHHFIRSASSGWWDIC